MFKRGVVVFVSIFFLLSPILVYGWWNTGHALAATIAYDNLTPKTKEAVNLILGKQIYSPGNSECSDAIKGYDIVSVSSWPDVIKTREWESKQVKKFYANAHFIDNSVDISKNGDVTSSKNDAESVIAKTIEKSKNDNIVSVINSCLKTLKTSKNANWENFSLRYLVHLTGDITQPLHATDPIIQNGNNEINTYGANGICFRKSLYVKNIDGTDEEIKNLHELWDAMGGGYDQILEKDSVNISKGNQDYLNNVSAELIKKYSYLNKEIYQCPDIETQWAVESYDTAIDYALPDSIFKNMKMYKRRVYINTPSLKYVDTVKEVSEKQVYIAGIRLAGMLNAIFDPHNKQTPKAYVEYIDKISGTDSVPLLSKLQNVNISITPKNK